MSRRSESQRALGRVLRFSSASAACRWLLTCLVLFKLLMPGVSQGREADRQADLPGVPLRTVKGREGI